MLIAFVDQTEDHTKMNNLGKLRQAKVLRAILRDMTFPSLSAGLRAKDIVLEKLKRNKILSIDRSFVGGSVGMGTELGDKHGGTDIDVVLFLNNVDYGSRFSPGNYKIKLNKQTNAIAKDVKVISKYRPETGIKFLQSTNRSARFSCRQDGMRIQVDLVCAINFIKPGDDMNNVPLIQRERVLHEMSLRRPRHLRYGSLGPWPFYVGRLYSSSLAEATIINSKAQEFGCCNLVNECRKLAKLFKYWVDQVLEDKDHSGSSYPFQLIMDASINQYLRDLGLAHKNRKETCCLLGLNKTSCQKSAAIVDVFEVFLSCLAELKGINAELTLDPSLEGNPYLWAKTNLSIAEVVNFFGESRIFIAEPTNPLNNIIPTKDEKRYKLLYSPAAFKSLERIRRYQENPDFELTPEKLW